MPRDDLSIDFVKKMPVEALDPALVLDDWINRVQNLPEEIRFIHDEILEKDRLYNDCIRGIEERDSKIQKWIKGHGALEPNPKEDALRAQIRERFAAADKLCVEKIALAQRMQAIMDKHLRGLDLQIKMLYDRNEPGFADPDELPSLLRPSAANHSAPSLRSVNPSANTIAPAMTASPPNPVQNSPNPSMPRPANTQARCPQVQQQPPHAASAPATPAAAMLLSRQVREGSAGPAPKRGPRANSGLTLTTASSNLARHSSLGPGTPRTATAPATTGVMRAGSVGPRAGSTKATSHPTSRKGTPGAIPRKRPAGTKSSLSRVKKHSRNSPASTADSELSEAESGSGEDEETRTTTADKPGGGGGNSEARAELDDDDDEEMVLDEEEIGEDKSLYCICQNVSYGDMVACDNPKCPYEWFHWSCVGLKNEPQGRWFCPVCREQNLSQPPKKTK